MNTAAADQTLLDAFLAALRAERTALEAAQTDALAELAARKLDCARQLEQAASPELRRRMRDAQTRLQRGLTPASAEDAALIGALREAAELNRGNGALIDQHLKHVRLSLSRIDAISPSRPLYGRDGQDRRSAPGRSFGSA